MQPPDETERREKRRRRVSLAPSDWRALDALAERTGRQRYQVLAAMIRAASAKLLREPREGAMSG